VNFLFEAFAWTISFFYDVTKSYGLAIVLLTIAVRVVLFPLTAKQAKSMQAMQRVQPELKRLQTKYKNDRQKLNEEMMKFYRENNINPLAGCLPLLLQMPLFIVLYNVIAGLTKVALVGALLTGGTVDGGRLEGERVRFTEISFSSVDDDSVANGRVVDAKVSARVVDGDGDVIGKLGSARVVNGRVVGPESAAVQILPIDGGSAIGTITGIEVADDPEDDGAPRVEGRPKYLDEASDLFVALRGAGGEMVSWGIDLSNSAAGASSEGFGTALPYFVLVAIVIATGYYQQRQMTARNPQAAQNPQAQMMGKIFPIVFGLISYSIQAGVVVYFAVSNLWQIGQQSLIFRNQAMTGAAEGGAAVVDTTAKEKPAKSPANPAKSPGKNRPTPKRDQRSRKKGGK
jgi:YidC/Oxa1 family membrane protein insertase